MTAATAHLIKNQNLQVKTDSYLLTTDDDLVVCNKTTAMTITLPVAVGRGKVFVIKSINTGTVTIDGDTDDTIDGEATQHITQWESVTVVDYVANKWVII
jgi:hypothetical protein